MNTIDKQGLEALGLGPISGSAVKPGGNGNQHVTVFWDDGIRVSWDVKPNGAVTNPHGTIQSKGSPKVHFPVG